MQNTCQLLVPIICSKPTNIGERPSLRKTGRLKKIGRLSIPLDYFEYHLYDLGWPRPRGLGGVWNNPRGKTTLHLLRSLSNPDVKSGNPCKPPEKRRPCRTAEVLVAMVLGPPRPANRKPAEPMRPRQRPPSALRPCQTMHLFREIASPPTISPHRESTRDSRRTEGSPRRPPRSLPPRFPELLASRVIHQVRRALGLG